MCRIVRKALFSARPVTMPGSTIGRMIRSETALRPKKRVFCNAIAAMVPSSSEITVASSATSTLTHGASRAPLDSAATFHQPSVKSCGGHANDRLTLKELSTTSASGA